MAMKDPRLEIAVEAVLARAVAHILAEQAAGDRTEAYRTRIEARRLQDEAASIRAAWLRPPAFVSLTAVRSPVGSRHDVHLYQGDADFVGQIAPILVSALREDSDVLVVATRTHRWAFERALTGAGLNVAALRGSGALGFLDARATLREILIDDSLDSTAFDAVVGVHVRDAAAAGRPLLVFGEMVDLLWHSGLVGAAVQLETLWNRLGEQAAFALVCAYERAHRDSDDRVSEFATICALHTLVVSGAYDHSSIDGVGSDDGPSETRGPPQTSREFLATPAASAGARSFASAALRRWHETDLLDDVVLVVSELATNAIRYAHSDFAVTLTGGQDSITVSVTDMGEGTIQPREADVTAVSGRGLAIVSAVAARWGWVQLRPGNRVWAEIGRTLAS